jgi:hypothetical protein
MNTATKQFGEDGEFITVSYSEDDVVKMWYGGLFDAASPAPDFMTYAGVIEDICNWIRSLSPITEGCKVHTVGYLSTATGHVTDITGNKAEVTGDNFRSSYMLSELVICTGPLFCKGECVVAPASK